MVVRRAFTVHSVLKMMIGQVMASQTRVIKQAVATIIKRLRNMYGAHKATCELTKEILSKISAMKVASNQSNKPSIHICKNLEAVLIMLLKYVLIHCIHGT